MRANEYGGSVTQWIGNLKAGDEKAAGRSGSVSRAASLVLSASDSAGPLVRSMTKRTSLSSAFHCLWRGATRGRFPQLAGRNDLWRLLARIAGQKAVDQQRHERRDKRGGGRTRRVVDLGDGDVLALVMDREPGPEAAALLDEECRRRLDRLPDHELRQIAIWKLEGESNDDIARRLGCGLRTVERKLGTIRAIWAGGQV